MRVVARAFGSSKVSSLFYVILRDSLLFSALFNDRFEENYLDSRLNRIKRMRLFLNLTTITSS